jgi:hypothetical protein
MFFRWFPNKKEEKKASEDSLYIENLRNSANSLTKIGFTDPSGDTLSITGISHALRQYAHILEQQQKSKDATP